MKLVPWLNTDDLNALNYPIIVEGWRRRLSGRVRLQYEACFAPDERDVLEFWYLRFQAWYLHNGTPKGAFMKLSEIALIKRAVNFFGGLA